MKSLGLLLLYLGISMASFAQKTFVLPSPDNRIALQVQLQSNGILQYSIGYRQKQVIKPSSLGFKLSKPAFTLLIS